MEQKPSSPINVLAIDPGTARCGIAVIVNGKLSAYTVSTDEIFAHLLNIANFYNHNIHIVAYETPTPFGGTAFMSLLETAFLLGAIAKLCAELFETANHYFVMRQTVKSLLCFTAKASDKDVREAVCFRWNLQRRDIKGSDAVAAAALATVVLDYHETLPTSIATLSQKLCRLIGGKTS